MSSAKIIEIPGVASKKRSRTENWLEQDKLLLKELVRERVGVIENKNTDSNTNKKKKDAWTDLHKIFNSLCTGAQRSINQLKSQWTMMKINIKKEKAQYRREFLRTGGGPHVKEPDNQDADDISSWLPMEFVIDNNEYDCDSTAVPKASVFSEKELVTLPEGLEVINNVEVVLAPVEVESPVELPTQEVFPNPLEVSTPLEMMSIPYELEDPLEEVSHIFNETNVKTKTEPSNNNKKQKLKKKAKQPTTINNKERTASAAAKIVELENKCRQELHDIQIENEKKKSRNLDLEYEVLSAKLNYYKNKMS